MASATVTRSLFDEVWGLAQVEAERAVSKGRAAEFYKTKKLPDLYHEGVIFRIVIAWQNAKLKAIQDTDRVIRQLQGSEEKARAEMVQKKKALESLPESPLEPINRPLTESRSFPNL